tara:strand:- start:189 stop:929 length:741 start_codon:yes stop_codon:yes gene_type:complete
MLKWFSQKKKEEILDSIDFSIIKTDLHSHLIPGIDDGSPDLESSILLIKELVKLGYKKIITTPHIMSDIYRNSPENILSGLQELKKEIQKQKIQVDIEAAAEYYIDFEFEQKIAEKKFLTFGDNYILIELSFSQAPNNLFDIIFKLQLEGYKVVLAHPERYGYYQKEHYDEFINRGVFLQINLLSLIGHYSPQIQSKTEDLIANNQVSFVGSDCHNMRHAQLYIECQNKKSWHDLVNSGKLLNYKL